MPPLTNDARLMLLSLLLMGALHLFMAVWLYATRLPALFIFKVEKPKSEKQVLDQLPRWARNPAANYNNLSEAPTTFYGVVLAVVLLGLADPLNAQLALGYVMVRLVHSLVQATVNIIPLRFAIFSTSWIILGTLIVRNLLALVL